MSLLDDLPHVLLEHVAGFLCAREYSSFALTSRACHAAADRVVPLVATNEIVLRMRAAETQPARPWIMQRLCAHRGASPRVCPRLPAPATNLDEEDVG